MSFNPGPPVWPGSNNAVQSSSSNGFRVPLPIHNPNNKRINDNVSTNNSSDNMIVYEPGTTNIIRPGGVRELAATQSPSRPREPPPRTGRAARMNRAPDPRYNSEEVVTDSMIRNLCTNPIAHNTTYQALYADSQGNRNQFVLHGAPLPLSVLQSNDRFKALLCRLEPGIKVNYKDLPKAIRIVRTAAATNSLHRGLDTTFQQLLDDHNVWLEAAMLYFSYHVYALMVNGLFIVKQDRTLLGLLYGMPKGARVIMQATENRLKEINVQDKMKQELAKRKNTMQTHFNKLAAVKTHPSFQRLAVEFANATIEDELRMRASRKQKENRTRRLEDRAYRTRGYMLANRQQQMGQLGTRNMDPDIEQEVLDQHHDQMSSLLPHYNTEADYKRKVEAGKQARERHPWMVNAGQKPSYDLEAGTWHGPNRMNF